MRCGGIFNKRFTANTPAESGSENFLKIGRELPPRVWYLAFWNTVYLLFVSLVVRVLGVSGAESALAARLLLVVRMRGRCQ